MAEADLPGTAGHRRWWDHERSADLALAAAASALFLGLLLVNGPNDLEQYHHSHPAVRLFHRALLEGRYLLWTDAFGLGTPLPLAENLAFHPFIVLAELSSLRLALSLFWLVHLAVGAYYFLRLCRLAEIDPLVARTVTLGFIASPATAAYAYSNDWPSVFLGWTMLPPVVFFFCRLAAAESPRRVWRLVSLNALVLGFLVWNAHPGHLVPLGAALVVFVLLLARGDVRVLARFALAAIGAAGVAGERIFFLLSETARFPPGLERLTGGPVPLGDWLAQLFSPLNRARILAPLVTGDAGAAVEQYLTALARVRTPFLGLVFSAAAVWFAASSLRAPPAAAPARLRRAAALTFCLAVVASVLPDRLLFHLPSGGLLFGDPAALFGLVAAGAALSDWRRRSSRARQVVAGALALQVAQLFLAVLPALLFVHRDPRNSVRFYAGERRAELASWVAGAVGDARGRTFLSPGVANLLLSEWAYLADYGLLATGDLEPLGLLPVNGYFKHVSMDALHPSLSRHHGFIGSHNRIVEDRTLFDLLAIDYLLVLDTESALDLSGFVPTGPAFRVDYLVTTPTGRLPSSASLRLLRNPDAWPLANHYAAEAAELTLDARSGPETPSGSRLPSCPAAGLLCRELGPLAEMRLATAVRSSGGDGRLLLAMEPAGEERLVVVSQLFRPEWRASSDGGSELPTIAVAGALLAIRVPPGVSEIELVYRPGWRLGLLALGATAALCCVAVLVMTGRRRSSAP